MLETMDLSVKTRGHGLFSIQYINKRLNFEHDIAYFVLLILNQQFRFDKSKI